MTGWGQNGPMAPRAGHDIDYIALAGALDPIGRAGERPVPPLIHRTGPDALGRQKFPSGGCGVDRAAPRAGGTAIWRVVLFASQALTWGDVGEAVGLGLITLVRVVVLMTLASLIWVPIGVWLGLRPVWARRAQPIAQFLAAFPANLLFPPFVLSIVYFHLSPDIWLTPLMVLGTSGTFCSTW